MKETSLVLDYCEDRHTMKNCTGELYCDKQDCDDGNLISILGESFFFF